MIPGSGEQGSVVLIYPEFIYVINIIPKVSQIPNDPYNVRPPR